MDASEYHRMQSENWMRRVEVIIRTEISAAFHENRRMNNVQLPARPYLDEGKKTIAMLSHLDVDHIYLP